MPFNIPVEIIMDICKILSIQELCILSLTCKQLSVIARVVLKRHKLTLKYFVRWYENTFIHKHYIRRSQMQYMGETAINNKSCAAQIICAAAKKMPKNQHLRQYLIDAVPKNTIDYDDFFADPTKFIPVQMSEVTTPYSASGKKLPGLPSWNGISEIFAPDTNKVVGVEYRTLTEPGEFITDLGVRNVAAEGLLTVTIGRTTIMKRNVRDCVYDRTSGTYWLFDEYLQIPTMPLPYLELTLTYKGICRDDTLLCVKTCFVPDLQYRSTLQSADYNIPFIDRSDESKTTMKMLCINPREGCCIKAF